MRTPRLPQAAASCALAVIALCLSSGISRGDNETWSASPSTANWSGTANWTGGIVPGNSSAGATPATDIATFNAAIPGNGIGGSTAQAINFDTVGDTIGGITFDTAAGSYDFKGDEAYISSGGSILLTAALSGSDTETFANTVGMGGSNATLTLENDSPASSFYFNTGGIAGGAGASTLYLVGSGTLANDLAAPITNGAGTLSMVVNGSDWVLTSSNNFSGGVTINSGTLAMGYDSAGSENVHSLGAGTVSLNGGELRLGGQGGSVTYFSIANNITSTGGTLFVADGYQTLTGNLAATSGTTYLYTQWAGKPLALSGVISGTGALWINAPNGGGDSGASVYFYNNTNTYSGTVTIDSTKSGFYGGFAYIGANNALAYASVVDNGRSGGIGFVAGVDAPVFGSLAGGDSFALTDGSAQPVALTIGGNNASTTYSGALSGSGSLTKNGNGTFIMSAASSYSGGTTINGGMIQVGNGSGQSVTTLGSGTVTINNGATLETGFISGQGTTYGFANSITLNNGAILGKDGISDFTSGSTSTFNVMGSGTMGGTYYDKQVYVSGATTGTGNLTIVYTGFDTGANTYDGSTVFFNNQLGASSNSFTGTISVQPNGLGFTDYVGNYLEIGGTYALANATLNLVGDNSGNSTNKGTVLFATGITGASIEALSGTGDLTLANQSSVAVALNVGGGTVNTSSTYGGILNGAGSLVVGGTAPFVLTGGNTYAGQTLINTGATLQLGNGTGGGSLAVTSAIVDNGTLVFDRGISIVQGTSFSTGAITGSGGIVQSGTGNVTLNNASNAFSGNVTVNSGTLTASIGGNNAGTTALGSDAAAGRVITVNSGGTLAFTNNNIFGNATSGTANLPTLVINAGGVLTSNRYDAIGNLDLNGGTLTENSSDTGAYQGWQFLGTVTVGGTMGSTIASLATGTSQYADHLFTNTVFNVANVTGGGVDLTVSAGLINSSGDFNAGGSLTKTGAGTMLLSGSNAYTGATLVSAGTLIVSGSLSGSSAVTVSPGATLASGDNTTSVVGAVADYGTLAPGGSGGSGLTSIGTLNMKGSLTLGATGTAGQLAMELGGTGTGQYDSIAFASGGLSLMDAQLELSLVNGYTPVNGDEFILTLGANSTTGQFTNAAGNLLTVGGDEFAVYYNGVGATGATSGGDDLILVAVPEPGTWGMLACGAALTILLEKRRKNLTTDNTDLHG